MRGSTETSEPSSCEAFHDDDKGVRVILPGPAEPYVGRNVGQIGIIVRDIESACKRYSAFWGNGPWRCFTYSPAILNYQEYHGEPSQFAVRIALNATEPQIELLEPLEGPSIYHDWLESRGEGLHHLAAFVDSADAAIESMAKIGYPVLQQGRGFGADGDGAFVYFDTERDFNYLLEVVERPKNRREPELVIP
jgi:methylmalonyl-CoA/ethylmalonyl-CoA epimerase